MSSDFSVLRERAALLRRSAAPYSRGVAQLRERMDFLHVSMDTQAGDENGGADGAVSMAGAAASLEAAVVAAMSRIRALGGQLPPAPPLADDDEDEAAARVRILRARKDAYSAAIDAAQRRKSMFVALGEANAAAAAAETGPSSSSSSSAAVDTDALAKAVLCARVDDDVAAGAETLDHLTGLVGSLSRELERERRNLVEAKAIRSSLEGEIARKGEAASRPANPSPASAINSEIERLSGTFGDLIRRLITFVERYFPTPERTEKAGKRKRGSQGQGNQGQGANGSGERAPYTPLKKVLESLMNASVDTPDEPYVPVTGEHFPPHIELLVRSGVAQRHPQDPNLITLTPFHK